MIANACVLVAEDNELIRGLLLMQLHKIGCRAVGVADGAEAAGAWRDGAFDLLLTDLQMPAVDGFELAALIRAEESGRRMPIVALTANALGSEAERCTAIGIDAYLTKPASMAVLRELMARLLPAAGAP